MRQRERRRRGARIADGQFRLTAREAEVLYWVAKGKTNRDIGDILGASPRTMTKHLEHILEKLGVETRTAAAALALARVPGGERGSGRCRRCRRFLLTAGVKWSAQGLST
jgi:DNA-binding CsgD family transcriptional regulator